MEGRPALIRLSTSRAAHWRAALVLLALASLLVGSGWAWRYLRPATRADALAVPAAVLASLQAGDLVFRVGTDPVSDSVRLVDGGGYSHVGLLSGAPGHWQVVHAVPAEVAGRDDAVVVDSLAFFLDPARARRAGFYRVRATPQLRARAVEFARNRIGDPFRIAAEGTTGETTYCTILIRDAYRRAGLDLQLRLQHLDLPLLQGDYLLPSALRDSPRVHVVHETGSAP